MEMVRLTSENVTAIPDDVRAALGVRIGDEIAWQLDGQNAVMRPVRRGEPPPGTTVLDSRVFAEWLTDEDDDLF